MVSGKSADRRINFVGDPAPGRAYGAERTNPPQDPAVCREAFGPGEPLENKIDRARRTVTGVRKRDQRRKRDRRLARKRGPEMRPGKQQPAQRNGREDQIVADATSLPITDRVPQHRARRTRRRFRWLTCIHLLAASLHASTTSKNCISIVTRPAEGTSIL